MSLSVVSNTLAPRCRTQTKAGKPCRAAATSGGLCFFHANPNKAYELGRIGGRRNRRASAAEDVDPLPKLDKVSALRDVVEKLIAEVYAGKLPPRVAAGLAPLLNLQLRVVDATDLERRLAKVEKLLARAEAKSSRKGYETPANDFRKPAL